MVTQAEKTGTIASLLDDVCTVLDSTTAWTDADTSVVNDQSDEEWHNNGRVYQNSNMGIYVFMHLAGYNAQQDRHETWHSTQDDPLTGIRVIISSDWDTDRHVPAGLCTVSNGDGTTESYVEIQRSQSFNTHVVDNNNGAAGIWLIQQYTSTRADVAAKEATYFASASDNYLSIAAWNNADGTYGTSSLMSIEYVDNKFYDDGVTPFCLINRTTASYQDSDTESYGATAYGFSDFRGRRYNMAKGMLGGHGSISEADWGRLNPDANDDTFFVKRPVIYRTPHQNVPVAYVEDSLPNDLQEGVAHGDTITYGGVSYRSIRQSGASKTNPVLACLRYE